jgi:hypothetical protein
MASTYHYLAAFLQMYLSVCLPTYLPAYLAISACPSEGWRTLSTYVGLWWQFWVHNPIRVCSRAGTLSELREANTCGWIVNAFASFCFIHQCATCSAFPYFAFGPQRIQFSDSLLASPWLLLDRPVLTMGSTHGLSPCECFVDEATGT